MTKETIYPCSIEHDGQWTTANGCRISLIGQHFNTPDGTEWREEEIRFVSVAAKSIDECPECAAPVSNSAPMLEGVAHQIYPCCMCDNFVWLWRSPISKEMQEEHA